MKTVYKKVVVMFTYRKKAKYIQAGFKRGQGCQSVLELNEGIFFSFHYKKHGLVR